MPIKKLTSLIYILLCLGYLLTMTQFPAEISAVFKILPLLLLLLPTIKFTLDSITIHLLTALLFSMGGDVLLQLGFFVPGLVSFLLAQLCYGSLFLRFRASWSQRFPIALLFVAFSLGMAVLMWNNAGEMRIPVMAYLAVITFMGLSANISAINYAVLGAAIFIFSDSIIALNRFVTPLPAADWLIMVSYYLAQYCLVTSILEFRASRYMERTSKGSV